MTEMNALILVGGKSSRMGEDKFLLDFNGQPQYEFLTEILQGLAIKTYLSCAEDQRVLIPDHYNLIYDIHQNIGPIGGIASAIDMDAHTDWLVIACDLVNLDKKTIQELITQDASGFDVITFGLPENQFLETTITLYKPSSFPTIRSMIENQQYKLQKVLKEMAVKVVIPSDPTRLKNVNTPKDL
ncbi:MAG: molybdopterin-guanine dinucleotide biosynthesis protein A [Cyclobacteriaceae bacterium]|jgi:molybdopterin-guanine dinucleotide biosynthesis protein A